MYKVGKLFFVALLLLFASCKKKTGKVEPIQFNPEHAKFVSAYTSGSIPRDGFIQVRFTQHVIPDEQIGKEANKNAFDFTPDLKGKATWVDARTIQFKPEALLDAGQVYEAKLDLGKFYDTVPSRLRYFPFQFNTPQQYVKVEMEGMMPVSEDNVTRQRFTGMLITREAENPVKIEKIIAAERGGSSLRIKWKHSGDGLSHRFLIDSIIRKQENDSIKVILDGKPVNYEELHSESWYRIPKLGDFTVTNFLVHNGNEQYIEIQYSDPLDPKQDLTGLIHWGNRRLKFSIDGGTIKVFNAAGNEIAKTASSVSHDEGNDDEMGEGDDPAPAPETQTKENSSSQKLTVEAGILNIKGKKTLRPFSRDAEFEDAQPKVRLVGKGMIIPESNGGIPFPFEAINLNAVDVQITKINEKSVFDFLRKRDMGNERDYYDYCQSYVGKVLLEKRIALDGDPKKNLHKWNRHALDLSKLVAMEPGAIYNVAIRYRKDYSLYDCPAGNEKNKSNDKELDILTRTGQSSFWSYYGGYDYSQSDNGPCTDNYYRRYDALVNRNILASNLGMLAKQGTDGSWLFAVTDLNTTEPLANIPIELYNPQKEVIKIIRTDKNGLANATVPEDEDIFVAVAKKEEQRGYLKLNSASLSLSRFDVSGEEHRKGVKGFIYTERGVWRPGDSIYITFLLEDKMQAVPINYPIVFEFFNPTGQLVQKMVRNTSLNGFYSFHTATDLNAPTGNYHVKINVGGVPFEKNIKVETVVPNRLKLDMKFAHDYISGSDKTIGTFNARWLSGAIAKNLDAEITIGFSKNEKPWDAYKDYTFNDPRIVIPSENTTLFQGKLDDQGNADIPNRLNISGAPGPFNASVYAKVTEPGGQFSTDFFVADFHAFDKYAGIRIPRGEGSENILLTGKDQSVEIAAVSKDGRPLNEKISLELYRIRHYWWYNYYDNESNSFQNREYHDPVDSAQVTTVNGKAVWKIKIPSDRYGLYFISARIKGGHTSGQFVNVDNENWYWRRSSGGGEGSTVLNFNTNKPKYKVGETAVLDIPVGFKGRALVTLESANRILRSDWFKTEEKNSKYEFKVTADMAPNVYVSITLIQPHAQTENDLPIRLFGVVPVIIDDPLSHLEPVLSLPKVIRPEETLNLSVKEKTGKAMTYTIAMVDEGLLDLTHFKTPDPWDFFNAKEALQIRTWDLYDFVLGNYTSRLKKLLTIGGDEYEESAGEGSKVQRFKPMVKFLGPFALAPGKTAIHKIRIPRYVGSVRTMVVAAENAAYGSTEETTPVRAPLMVLGTLPRVLGPDEEVQLPVSVFAMEDFVKDVQITVKSNPILEIEGDNTKTVHFSEKGDKLVTFPCKVKPEVGIARVQITATSGKETAHYDIELDVRAPNPRISKTTELVAEPGKNVSASYEVFGYKGTNKATLEISTLPPLNLDDRLQYLIQYPHGCIEQTTSSIFPQLYVYRLLNLSPERKKEIEDNIKAGIRRLQLFQLPSGAMSYWPDYGEYEPSIWGTNYAGHFLLEAQAQGYNIPGGMLEKWKAFQKDQANSWKAPTPPANVNASYNYFHYYEDREELTQAYRLYLLAVAKSPEMGAMNRLREMQNLPVTAKWLLAAAYLESGQKQPAVELTKGLGVRIPYYRELGYTYGSEFRDEAIILQALTLLGWQEDAFKQEKYLSDILKSNQWLSTQETAYCLMALCQAGLKFSPGGLMAEYRINGGAWQTIKSVQPLTQLRLDIKENPKGTVEIRNKSNGQLYTDLILSGIPTQGNEVAESKGVSLYVNYFTKDGRELDPTSLEQGTDFIAEFQVDNPDAVVSLDNMALTTIFPSGWQIYNPRMTGEQFKVQTSQPTYLDVRDDRVNYYFDLKAPDYWDYYYYRWHQNRFDEYGNAIENPRSNHKVFRVMLNASFAGRFYLPSVYMEAMYDKSIHAGTTGRWVKVTKGEKPTAQR
jgi:hypothetical protein